MARNNNFNVFTEEKEIGGGIPDGNYIFTVDSIEEHPEGPNMKMLMHNENYTLKHVIFPSNVDYHRSTLGRQLGYSPKDKKSIKDILLATIGKQLQVYITHPVVNGQVRQNVSFYTPIATEEETETAEAL